MARETDGFAWPLTSGLPEPPMHHYAAWGLTIESELDIPGAVLLDEVNTPPADIVVSLGEANIGPVDAVNGPYQRSGDQLLFTAPGVARYLAQGARLLVEPDKHVDPEQVSALLIATGLPMLLWPRADLLLHGSAIIAPGAQSAIGFIGPSGAGKSTIVDQMVRLGARVVGDDSLRLLDVGGEWLAHGLPASYFLPLAGQSARETVAVPLGQRATGAPLSALFVLDPEIKSSAPPFTPLSGVAALEAVLRNRHRPRIPAILGLEKFVFQQSLMLSKRLPLYAWQRNEGGLTLCGVELMPFMADLNKGQM